jgi:hypothetical protein
VAGERLAHLRTASLALVDQLTPDDEAALVTFNHAVSIAAPPESGGERVRVLAEAEPWGRTALIDAAQAAMLLAGTRIGRSLLIVFSDGVDTASWLTAESVLDTARRSDVVAYVVTMRQGRKPVFASELTSVTGGSLITIDSTRDLHATFLRILEEFRHRYVLSYTPEGVTKGGWHQLDVRVKGRRASVRARHGYRRSEVSQATPCPGQGSSPSSRAHRSSSTRGQAMCAGGGGHGGEEPPAGSRRGRSGYTLVTCGEGSLELISRSVRIRHARELDTAGPSAPCEASAEPHGAGAPLHG